MVATRVADMSVDELKSLIQETVTETLLDLFRDPDDGLELRDNFKSVLQHSLSVVGAGEKTLAADTDDFDREIALTQQNEELMLFLERRAQQMQTVGLADVKEQFGLR